MSTQRIVDTLQALFHSNRVVFWNDPEAEFASAVDSLPLGGVCLVKPNETPALKVKLDMERGSPSAKWLYAPQAEPEPAKDWLLDIRLTQPG